MEDTHNISNSGNQRSCSNPCKVLNICLILIKELPNYSLVEVVCQF